MVAYLLPEWCKIARPSLPFEVGSWLLNSWIDIQMYSAMMMPIDQYDYIIYPTNFMCVHYVCMYVCNVMYVCMVWYGMDVCMYVCLCVYVCM